MSIYFVTFRLKFFWESGIFNLLLTIFEKKNLNFLNILYLYLICKHKL